MTYDSTTQQGIPARPAAAATPHVQLPYDPALAETGAPRIFYGTVSPEGNVTGVVGDRYIHRVTGAEWQKLSGSGTTGWVSVNAMLAELYGDEKTVLASGADDTDLILSTIASLPTTGGTIRLPSPEYQLDESLDLTLVAGRPIRIRGAGPRATTLISSVTDTPAIIAANADTRFMVLEDFSLYQSGLALPGAQVAGNYGVKTVEGVGFALLLNRVEINYFANNAVQVEGPTGPTVVRDCSIQHNAGYGVAAVGVVAGNSQDVFVTGGNIQFGWGGVYAYQASSLLLQKLDIELSDDGMLPGIHVDGGTTGSLAVDIDSCTVATGAAATGVPAGLVSLAGILYAVTIRGGLNDALNGVDNILLDGAYVKQLTVIGGHYNNKAVGGGYFMNFSGASNSDTDIVVINPHANPGTYGSGKAIVNDNANMQHGALVLGSSVGSNSGVQFTNEGWRRIPGRMLPLDWGTYVIPDCAQASFFKVIATSDIAATVAAPVNAPVIHNYNSQGIRIMMLNSSGGALSTPITFATTAGGYKATGDVALNDGERMVVDFIFDRLDNVWVEVGRTAAAV